VPSPKNFELKNNFQNNKIESKPDFSTVHSKAVCPEKSQRLHAMVNALISHRFTKISLALTFVDFILTN
jgi:hypothetical protein